MENLTHSFYSKQSLIITLSHMSTKEITIVFKRLKFNIGVNRINAFRAYRTVLHPNSADDSLTEDSKLNAQPKILIY